MNTTPIAAATVTAIASVTLSACPVRSSTMRNAVSTARPAASANSRRTAQSNVAEFSCVTQAPYRQYGRPFPGTVPRMRALLVVNPKATTTTERSRDVLVRALRSQVELAVEYTRRRGHAAALTRAAAESGV